MKNRLHSEKWEGEQGKMFRERFQEKSMYPNFKKESNVSKIETKAYEIHARTNKAGELNTTISKKKS